MEIVVTGRHTEVPERFRRHLEEKLAKVTQLAPRVQRLDVVISHEPNRRQSKACERVEITCLDRGSGRACRGLCRRPVRRAGHGHGQAARAAAPDARPPAGAPRPARARGAVRGLGAGRPAAGPRSTARRPPSRTCRSCAEDVRLDEGESPVVIREKTHTAHPMTLDQALYEMELVGHDFFLFVDSEVRRTERGVPAAGLVVRRHPAGQRTRPAQPVGAGSRGDRVSLGGAEPRGRAMMSGEASAAIRRGRWGPTIRRDPGPQSPVHRPAREEAVIERTARDAGGNSSGRPDPGARRRRPRALPARPGDGAQPRGRASRSSARPATAPRRSAGPRSCCPTSS